MTGGGNGGINLYKYHYPTSRQRIVPSAPGEPENPPMGVVGTLELLNSKVISTQPIVSFDWNVDKEGLSAMTCLDQTLRVFIVTKLNKY